MRPTVILTLLGLSTSACFGMEPLNVIGDQCDKNSDCQAPLVCALGRCRNQCEATRDCALGLRCIQLQDLGVCQLPEEATCGGDADCEAPLRCRDPGGCVMGCETDLGCPAGATCTGGECVEPSVPFCVYDSDCAYPQVCGFRQECRRECATRVDCSPGQRCVQHAGCADGPCMCRIPCDGGEATCPLGTDCVPCGAGLDCDGSAAYCERPDPDGGGAGA